jgi:hypothetical protein
MKIERLDYIVTRWVSDGATELAEPVRYLLNGDAKITIQPRFRFDGASIPRFFWRVIGSPFVGRYRSAALLHDALYSAEIYSRRKCDHLFLVAMANDGVVWWRRNAMWAAVRIGGGFVWRKHTAQSVAEARELVIIG